MTAKELLAMYASRAPWLKPDTVDRIVYGDPSKPIKRLLVTWQADIETVRYAGEHGFDAIMVHEPTFYFHADEWRSVLALDDSSPKKKTAMEKAALLDRYGLVVMRNHDVWDAMPDIGITWEWARYLELGEPVARSENGFQLAFSVPKTTLRELAARLSAKLEAIGDTPPVFYGQPDATVTRLGIGTGCITRVEDYLKMGCDAGILCDDGTSYWQDVALALDAGLSVLRVAHGASEEPGVRAMARDARERLPDCHVEPYPLRLKGFMAESF